MKTLSKQLIEVADRLSSNGQYEAAYMIMKTLYEYDTEGAQPHKDEQIRWARKYNALHYLELIKNYRLTFNASLKESKTSVDELISEGLLQKI
jgi:ribosomal protein L7/L12